MTRQEFDSQIEENCESLFFDIVDECARLLRSGAIDLGAAENNARLPKQVLCVVLQNLSAQFMPPDAKGRAIVKNLGRF